MENAVPVHPAIPSKTASENPMCRPSMNGMPLTMAQANQNSATEDMAVESRLPCLLRGRFLRTMPVMKNVAGTVAMGRSIFHSEKRTATIRGTQVSGAINVKISPRSEKIVERYPSRRITSGLIAVLY